MNANNLESNVKEVSQISFSFGKNGWGITDEFIKIGTRLAELSKTHNVYLEEAKIDSMDDVYDLTFSLYPVTDD